jgi:hypothetical protein
MIRIETNGPVGVEFDSWRAKAEKARYAMIQEYVEEAKVPDPNRYQHIWRELKDVFLTHVFKKVRILRGEVSVT